MKNKPVKLPKNTMSLILALGQRPLIPITNRQAQAEGAMIARRTQGSIKVLRSRQGQRYLAMLEPVEISWIGEINIEIKKKQKNV